jgi:hypothetical protein
MKKAVQTIKTSDALYRASSKVIKNTIIYVFPEHQQEIQHRPDVWIIDAKNKKNAVAKMAQLATTIATNNIFFVCEGHKNTPWIANTLCAAFSLPLLFPKHPHAGKEMASIMEVIKNSQKAKTLKTNRTLLVDLTISQGRRMMFLTVSNKTTVTELTAKYAYELSITEPEVEIVKLLEFVPEDNIVDHIEKQIININKQEQYEQHYRKRNAKNSVSLLNE